MVSAEAEVASEVVTVAAEVALVVAEVVSAVVVSFSYLLICLGFNMGPPEYVEAVAEFSHDCEGMLIAFLHTDAVPLLMRSIYLANKNLVGKVDDVFGAQKKGGIAIKPAEGVKAESFKAGDKVSNPIVINTM